MAAAHFPEFVIAVSITSFAVGFAGARLCVWLFDH